MRYLDNDLWLWARVRGTTALDRLRAGRALRSHPEMFDEIKCFCTFIGYPRSGHSVVSSILDAHPNAAFSHRLDALKFIGRGSSPESVFYLILKNSQRFAKQGRRLTAYAYPISAQWQGKTQSLSVLGDQEGKWATLRLLRNPKLLDSIRTRDIELKFIHVVRNPFDNITTMANRRQQRLEPAIEDYFELCEGVAMVKRSFAAEQVLDIRHETLIFQPRSCISELCAFLDLDAPPAFLESCEEMLFDRPNRSRESRAWTPALIEQVTKRAEGFEFLTGYSYAN